MHNTKQLKNIYTLHPTLTDDDDYAKYLQIQTEWVSLHTCEKFADE